MGYWPLVDAGYIQEYHRGLNEYAVNLIFAFIQNEPELFSHIFQTCDGTKENLEKRLSEMLDATYSYITLGHIYDNKFSEDQPYLKKILIDTFNIINAKDFTATALKLCSEVYYLLIGIKETEEYL